jgi:thiamine-phosphate diphosphorylase
VTALARPCICLVTDRRQLSPDARTTADEIRALNHWIEEAMDLVDVIQIRERDLEGARLMALASEVASKATGTRTAVVVNDRADVALAAGAGGVHLRADGPAVERVRAIGPRGWIVGRSIHSAGEAATSTADYVVFGTVFQSRSKPQGPAQGIEHLQAAARVSRSPLLAIGGIDPGRAADCCSAGAAGIAAIGMFLPEGRAPGSLGITRAVAALRAAMTSR